VVTRFNAACGSVKNHFWHNASQFCRRKNLTALSCE
jgi:hypothetical protein